MLPNSLERNLFTNQKFYASEQIIPPSNNLKKIKKFRQSQEEPKPQCKQQILPVVIAMYMGTELNKVKRR